MISILIGILWIGCGLYSYAKTFAYLQNEYIKLAESQYKLDLSFSILIGLFGICSVIIIYFEFRGNYGLKWK